MENPAYHAPKRLDYESPTSSGAARFRISVLWMLVPLVPLTVIFVMLCREGLNKPREVSSKSECCSRLHQLGLGILLYSQDSGGAYPDSFQSLMLNGQNDAYTFVCPQSNENPTTAPTTQERAADMAKPEYVSYIYLGKGLTEKTVLPNQIIVYEPLANHGDGISVLAGDGHAEFVDAKRAAKIISDANAGVRPVMLPP